MKRIYIYSLLVSLVLIIQLIGCEKNGLNVTLVELKQEQSHAQAKLYQYMIEEVESAVVSYSAVSNNEDRSKTYSRFTIGHCSDVHAFGRNSITNLNEFIDFFHRPLIHPRVDLLLCTGDLSNGVYTRLKKETLLEIESVMTPFLSQDIPTMVLVGNHDSNINETSFTADKEILYKNSLSKEEQYEYIVENICNKWTFENINNSCYYFKDFNEYKIRVISLDFIDYPIVKDNVTDQIKYKMNYIFSQKQLEWLYEVLLNTPDDYGVIIASHALPDVRNGIWQQGVNLLYNIIHAYQTGGKYSHSWICSKYIDLSTALDFDFSEELPKEFICWVGGHTHRRAFTYENIDNTPQLMITTPALYTESFVNLSGYIAPTLRENNTITQNSFNILQIDRVQKKIIITIFGAYLDFNCGILNRVNIISY